MRFMPRGGDLAWLALLMPAGLAAAVALGLRPGPASFFLVLVAAWVAGIARGGLVVARPGREH
jgi:hypothetical protein